MDTEEAILHESSVEDDTKSIEEVRGGIYDAVIKGSFDVSMNFTVEGKDVLLNVTPIENTVLHIAAKYRKNDVAQQVIEKYPSLLYKKNQKGNTPLHIAASLGDEDMTKFLLERAKGQRDIEANTPLIKMENLEKDTALHVAVRNGQAKIVDLLIDEDHELTSLTNNAGESPLFMAVDGGFDEIADSILKIPNCSYRGRKGMNVLHAAVIRKDNKETPPVAGNPFEIICKYALYLLRQSCCNGTYEPIPKPKDSESESTTEPEDSESESTDLLERMLKIFRDAMVEADDVFGWIPLHYAAYFGYVEVVELFLDKNISLAYKTDREGMSALHISAKEGHFNVVRKLFEKCPYTSELLDNRDRTALHLAMESGQAKSLEQLELFPYLSNEQDKDGNTPFHLAAIKKHYVLLTNLADLPDWMEFASVAMKAMNKEGMSTFDIIQSDNTLTSEKKFEILDKLNAEKSLERVVHIQTAKKQTVEASPQVQTEQSDQEIEEEELGVFGDGTDASFNAQVGTDASSQEKLKNMFHTNILVATLVATVTFAAAFQVPGGYDDNGQAILSENTSFLGFMIFDSLAFGFSAASIFIHFFASYAPKLSKLVYPEQLVLILNEMGILFALVAFLCGVRAVLAEKSSLATAIAYCVLGSFFLSILGIPINIGWLFILFVSKRLRFYNTEYLNTP